MDEEKYIHGFNSGYELQRLKPELLSKIFSQFNKDSDYLLGLREGREAYDKEYQQHMDFIQDKGPKPENDRNDDLEQSR